MLENVVLVIFRRKIGYAVYALIFYSSMKRIATENMDFQKLFFGGGVVRPPRTRPSVQACFLGGALPPDPLFSLISPF